MQSADTGTAYGFNRPTVHRDVIGMPGLTVRWKCQNRIRCYLENDLCDLLCGCMAVCIGATAIRISHPAVLLDPQDFKARC
jgi:hypothetical protein